MYPLLFCIHQLNKWEGEAAYWQKNCFNEKLGGNLTSGVDAAMGDKKLVSFEDCHIQFTIRPLPIQNSEFPFQRIHTFL